MHRLTRAAVLLFGIAACLLAQRTAVERMAPERLKATAEARKALAAKRSIFPPIGVYKSYRAVLHIHAEDSNHTFGTRQEVLAAAKAAGIQVVMLSDHRGPKAETWQGIRDGVLFFAGSEDDHLLRYPAPAPGLRFHSHVEDQLDAPVEGFDGMEIYNRHTDTTDDKGVAEYLKEQMGSPERWKAFAQLAAEYPDEIYGAGTDYWPQIFARWDKILAERKFPGISANDAHQNQVFGDAKRGGRVVLDPYGVAFRNAVTHVFAHDLTEREIQQALRLGRSYVAHDWLCDPDGFAFYASNNQGLFELGDEVPLRGRTTLALRSPVAAKLKVIYGGKVIAEQVGQHLAVPANEPGAYRAEAWLEIDGEWRPWIYSNPIYAKRPPDTSIPTEPLPSVATITRDISYVEGESSAGEKHKLDIYQPAGGAGPHPVLLFVHGGSWRSGDRKLYGRLGSRFAQYGYVTVIPSYRLSPAHKHPSHVEDVAAAFAWTVKHAAKFGGDAKRIFLAGHSAGAHLVSLLATNKRYLARHGHAPADIRGVVSISGVYDVSRVSPQAFGADESGWKDASPMAHVTRDAPPMMIAYCQWDYMTLPQQALRFHNAARAAGAKTQLHYINGEDHISEIISLSEENDPTAREVLKYLRSLEGR